LQQVSQFPPRGVSRPQSGIAGIGQQAQPVQAFVDQIFSFVIPFHPLSQGSLGAIMSEFFEIVNVTIDTTAPAMLVQNTNQTNQAGPGMMAKSAAVGVWGESFTWNGTVGISHSTTGGAGVWGKGEGGGTGVAGISTAWVGVYGETNGSENGPAGIWGDGKNGGDGVKGHASGPGRCGVGGFHLTGQGPGILGQGNPAGRFIGDVEVTGDIRLVNADCAEDFTVADPVAAEPGTVMVLGDGGTLEPCAMSFDSRVVGVVSGAGSYRPAIILDRREAEDGTSRRPIALMGKVWCKVDATLHPIMPGDILTTSAVPGHAMKAADPRRATGAILGKALAACAGGSGLIPILVTLQ
jgi:hypothetical protein